MYDQTLVALERLVLADKLAHLTAGLMDVATYQYGATGDPRIKEAARLNPGYLAVAARLLNSGAPIPALVGPQVAAEPALIKAHQGFALSPLFGYAMDYSQLVPRGHYTASEALRRYVQAMTWYGRVAFRLNGPDRLLRTRQALLLVRGVTRVPTLGALWAASFDPITAWVGQSDDLTVRNYAAVMARVYPANAPVGVLSDDARLARFIALANALPDPQISSDLVPWHQNATRLTRGLRLFGQRFVLDAAIMQALIYPRVGTRQNPRVWTTGLDVAASLGSRQATALLTGPLHQDRYAHYVTGLAAVQAHESALPAATRHQNLYWRWLDTLRAVWEPMPGGAPAFMKTAAWAEKSLGTGLGLWAELRHDTLLYAIVPIAGRSWLARGGVFSYYEFHQPMSDRLSDQVWHHMPRRPGQPAWTAGYITS